MYSINIYYRKQNVLHPKLTFFFFKRTRVHHLWCAGHCCHNKEKRKSLFRNILVYLVESPKLAFGFYKSYFTIGERLIHDYMTTWHIFTWLKKFLLNSDYFKSRNMKSCCKCTLHSVQFLGRDMFFSSDEPCHHLFLGYSKRALPNSLDRI